MHPFFRASLAVGVSLLGGFALLLFLEPEIWMPPGELARSFLDSGAWIVVVAVIGGSLLFWLWERFLRSPSPEIFVRASLVVGASLLGGFALLLLFKPETWVPPGEIAASFLDSGSWIVVLAVIGGSLTFWLGERFLRSPKREND